MLPGKIIQSKSPNFRSIGLYKPWAIEQIEIERQRAAQERQKAERLAEYLRSQGINPDELS